MSIALPVPLSPVGSCAWTPRGQKELPAPACPPPLTPGPASPLLTWPPLRRPLSLCSRGRCSQTCGLGRGVNREAVSVWGVPIHLLYTERGTEKGGSLPRIPQQVRLRGRTSGGRPEKSWLHSPPTVSLTHRTRDPGWRRGFHRNGTLRQGAEKFRVLAPGSPKQRSRARVGESSLASPPAGCGPLASPLPSVDLGFSAL